MQFGTWASLGFSDEPYQEPASVQDAMALKLYNELGWAPWSTAAACGL